MEGWTMRVSMICAAVVMAALVCLAAETAYAQAVWGSSNRHYGARDPLACMESDLRQASAIVGDGGCGSCDTCGQGDSGCCGPDSRFTAGVEATYLRPYLESNILSNQNELFSDFTYEAAPRIWVGFENCGRGLRARYWQYDAEAERISDASFVSDNDSGDSVFFDEFTADMEAYTIDIEVTKRFQRNCWDILATLGVRHAAVAYRNHQREFSSDSDVTNIDTLDLSRRFDGLGVTVSAEGRRPIGGSRLAFFWTARGSACWGDNKAQFFQVQDGVLEDGNLSASFNSSFESENDVLYIGEFQLGIEWRQGLECCSGTVFARTSFEGQIWNLEDSDIEGSLIPEDSLGNGYFGFYGLAFAVGFER
jgi:hypothetical protein